MTKGITRIPRSEITLDDNYFVDLPLVLLLRKQRNEEAQNAEGAEGKGNGSNSIDWLRLEIKGSCTT